MVPCYVSMLQIRTAFPSKVLVCVLTAFSLVVLAFSTVGHSLLVKLHAFSPPSGDPLPPPSLRHESDANGPRKAGISAVIAAE